MNLNYLSTYNKTEPFISIKFLKALIGIRQNNKQVLNALHTLKQAVYCRQFL